MPGTFVFSVIVNMQFQSASDSGSSSPGFEPKERHAVSFMNTL